MNFFHALPKESECRDRNFAIASRRIDDAKAMGFDVIYFPPIHPIGFTKRKGRNNSVTSEPARPGVPYAIGSQFGGHKAVEPELGTLDDFDWLVNKCTQEAWRSLLISRSTVRRTILTSMIIQIGFFIDRTERSSTPKILLKNTRMSIP